MNERLALVTGATSGIGKAICQLLARKGLALIATGRNQIQLQLLQGQLSSKVVIQTIPLDLNQPSERQNLIEMIHHQKPDLVINNAGFGLYGEALTYSTQEQLAILEVNSKAVLELTLEAARTLISAEKSGVILNVSSAAGFQNYPNMAVYAASKAFVNHFSQAFDFEVKKYGVRILTICPGMVETSFQKRAGSREEKIPGMLSAPFVAEQIWKQIEELKTLSIIDWKYRLLTFISHLFPQRWVANIEQKIIETRISTRPFIKVKK